MSNESFDSRALTNGASALELSLARVVAHCRDEYRLEIRALEYERKLALNELQKVVDELERVRVEADRWLDEMRAQKLELRGEPGPCGAPGPQGAAGHDGRDGLPGVPGPAGRDGRDGTNGKDGVDGLGVSDFDIAYDGERTMTLKWANGDRNIERSFRMPLVIYRGPYEHGEKYDRGDAVTYGGSIFVAKKATSIKPETDDWQLAVKKGLPGTRGKDGERGPAGPGGRDGRDLTSMTFDGMKY